MEFGQGDIGIDNAVGNVLSDKRLLLSHPGASKFNQLYATADKSTTNLAETVNSRGRLRQSSNSKALGSRSDFYISSSSLVSDIMITFSVTTTAATHMMQRGWGFQAINSIEITYANSLIQNLVISGPILREMLLLSCRDQEARENLLLNAGDHVFGAKVDNYACIPVPLLNQNASGVCSNYPLDFSVMNGPMTVSIIWNKSQSFIMSSDDTDITASLALISQLSNATIVTQTSDLQDGAFSVKRALNMNPELVYSIPSKYVNTIVYKQNVAYDGNNKDKIQINLNSAPSGILSHMIFNVHPTSWETGTANGLTQIFGSSVDLFSYKLTYGGQALYQSDSYPEMCAFDLQSYGDSLLYDEYFALGGVAKPAAGAVQTLADGDDGVVKRRMRSRIYHIPLAHDAREVIRAHLTENLPSYSGATLQLELVLNKNKSQYALMANKSGNASNFVAIQNWPWEKNNYENPNNVQYSVHIGYVLESLLEVSNGTVDLQL